MELNEALKIYEKSKKDKSFKYKPATDQEFKELVKSIVKKDPEADLNFIDTSKVETIYGLFYEFKGLEFNGKFDKWDMSNVHDADYAFENCKLGEESLKGIENWNFKNLISGVDMFAGSDLPRGLKLNLPELRFAAKMFKDTNVKDEIQLHVPKVYTLEQLLEGNENYGGDLSYLDDYVNPKSNKEKLKELHEFRKELLKFHEEYGHNWDSSNVEWTDTDFVDYIDPDRWKRLTFQSRYAPQDIYADIRRHSELEKFLDEDYPDEVIVDELDPSLSLYDDQDWKKYVNFMRLTKREKKPYVDASDKPDYKTLNSWVARSNDLATRIANNSAVLKIVHSSLCD